MTDHAKNAVDKIALTDGVPGPAGPYSHVAVVGNLVLSAGFGPQDPATGVIPEGIEAQTAAVLGNIAAALAAVGAGLDDVVKATVHLHEPTRDYAGFNAAYERHFTAPYPVRTTVGSELLGILAEIDVVAHRGGQA